MRLVAGTRGSALATTQTAGVLDLLRAEHAGVEIATRIVRTEGDIRADQPLSEIGGKGAFVKELEASIARGEIDFAVHSLKDVPAMIPDGFTLAAVLSRADARDAVASRSGQSLAELPPRAVIATGSSRRAVQIRQIRPDLVVRPIRGNVDTRLRKLDDGEYDAIILAAAGLHRLGREGRVTEYLDPNVVIPAPGQGALAIETKSDSPHLSLLRSLDDLPTRQATQAERAFLAMLGADCWLPVAAHAIVAGDQITMKAMLANDDGVVAKHEAKASLDDAIALGESMAHDLMARTGISKGVRR